MDTARPLRDVFTGLVGAGGDATEPADILRDSGHPDLPDALVAEAVGSYADTAPVEVAEHLSAYVMAHSPVPLPDAPEVPAASWLDLVASAPSAPIDEDSTGHDPLADLDGPHAGLIHAGESSTRPDHDLHDDDLDDMTNQGDSALGAAHVDDTTSGPGDVTNYGGGQTEKTWESHDLTFGHGGPAHGDGGVPPVHADVTAPPGGGSDPADGTDGFDHLDDLQGSHQQPDLADPAAALDDENGEDDGGSDLDAD